MFDFFAVYMLIQVVLAFMLCFFGYRHLRLLLSIYAFMAGFLGCYLLIASLSLTVLLKNILCIVAGLLISGLTYVFYKIAMFAAGAGLGLTAGVILCYSFSIPIFGTIGLVILLALGLAAGALSIGYKRLILILSTSICGALLLSLHGGYLIDRFAHVGFGLLTIQQPLHSTFLALQTFFSTSLPYILGATLILAIAGMVLQFKKGGRRK